MIDPSKKYRFRNVPDAEILAIVERDGFLAVMFTKDGNVHAGWHNEDGSVQGYENKDYNLVEVSPYDGWEVDRRVIVTNLTLTDGSPDWGRGERRHFKGVNDSGKPEAYINGMTSFTAGARDYFEWKFAKPADGPDLII